MKVVIDASIGIHTVLASSLSAEVEAAWESWRDQSASVLAPTLWLNEITSVLHRIFIQGLVSEAHAHEALDRALELELDWGAETLELCRTRFGGRAAWGSTPRTMGSTLRWRNTWQPSLGRPTCAC